MLFIRLLLLLCLILPVQAEITGTIPRDKIIDLYTNKESKRLEDWFESTIQNRAKAQWQAPEQNFSSLTALLLRLSPEGEIKDVETVYNSGSPALEASTHKALLAVSPTPVKPPVVFKDHTVILFTFEHKINDQDISNIDKNFKNNTDYQKRSQSYYLKLAEKNNPSVLYDLGEFHISAIPPFTKDYSKAFNYFKRSSDLGFIPAKNAMAALYAIGLGSAKDPAKAFILFKEAADAGFISAQINLARCYIHGEGTERNARQAALYYEKASRKGSNLAERELKILNQMVKDNQI